MGGSLGQIDIYVCRTNFFLIQRGSDSFSSNDMYFETTNYEFLHTYKFKFIAIFITSAIYIY